MTATITPRSWAEFIRREYLADFVREGGAAIKFGVPLEEPARAATRNALDEVARGCGFISMLPRRESIRLIGCFFE